MWVENYFVTFIKKKLKTKMSRIGNNPIIIPEGVNIDIQLNKIIVKGKLGELTQDYSDVTFEIKDNILIVIFF